MFTRTFTCALKSGAKEEFLEYMRTGVLPAYQGQPGFIDLLTLVSDEHPDKALLLVLWKTKGEAEAFYRHDAPLVDSLKRFVDQSEVEHYFLETSTVFKIASGKAA